MGPIILCNPNKQRLLALVGKENTYRQGPPSLTLRPKPTPDLEP